MLNGMFCSFIHSFSFTCLLSFSHANILSYHTTTNLLLTHHYPRAKKAAEKGARAALGRDTSANRQVISTPGLFRKENKDGTSASSSSSGSSTSTSGSGSGTSSSGSNAPKRTPLRLGL